MSRPEGYDAAHLNVGLMTDEELYAVYLRASGYPRKQYGYAVVEGYHRSAEKRVLTALDAALYMIFALTIGPAACILVIPMGLCAFGIAAGPTSLIGLAYHFSLAAQEERPPPLDSALLHSPETLSRIVEYLAEPILGRARTLLVRLDGECTVLERQLAKSFDLRDSLLAQQRNLVDPSLAGAFDARIAETLQAIEHLKDRHGILKGYIDRVYQEKAVVEKQVAEVRTLAEAKKHLASVGSKSAGLTTEERSSILDRIASLGAHMELAQENLTQVSSTLAAREKAESEVRQLSQGNDSVSNTA